MSQDDLEMDFAEFRALVEQTTENMKRLAAAQQQMRWQFGNPDWFVDFVAELNDTNTGWVASNC